MLKDLHCRPKKYLAVILTLVAVYSLLERDEPPSACEHLNVAPPLIVIHDIGEIMFDEFRRHDFWISSEEGNITDEKLYDRRTDNFHFDGLYRLNRHGKSWMFRHGGQAFNTDGTQRTLFYDVQWDSGRFPQKGGTYQVEALREIRKHGVKPTLNTVGDSITWWQHGEYFRCMLVDAGLSFQFTGSRTDTFGYGHDGEGGNTTRDVLKRMNAIAPSSNYFLLIGTNDRFNADETTTNIMKIARQLRSKQNGIVWVSTLLPRTDEFNERNIRVNAKLRQLIKHCTDCENINLIDSYNAMLKQPEWPNLLSDGLHPNKKGYAFLASVVSSEMNDAVLGVSKLNH